MRVRSPNLVSVTFSRTRSGSTSVVPEKMGAARALVAMLITSAQVKAIFFRVFFILFSNEQE